MPALPLRRALRPPHPVPGVRAAHVQPVVLLRAGGQAGQPAGTVRAPLQQVLLLPRRVSQVSFEIHCVLCGKHFSQVSFEYFSLVFFTMVVEHCEFFCGYNFLYNPFTLF